MKKLVLAMALALTGCNLAGARQPPDAAAPPPPPPPPPAPVVPANPLDAAGLSRASVTVTGPLEGDIRAAVGDEVGSPLAQVTARLLIWWVDVQRGMRKGDKVDVVYQLIPGKEPLVHAVRFFSTKDAKEYRAYLFKPEGAAFAHYYQPSGEELEERLRDSPIDDYEQVTSILRDGRRHKGVDFKAPVGSPVKAPFDAVVTRKNWSWKSNGNCLELRDSAGRRIVFLHLAEIPKSLSVGKRFRAGEVVAQSGNTGRSTAPHLHYQLESPSGKLLDPYEVHPTYRAKLDEASMPTYLAEVARLDKLIDYDPNAAPPPPPGPAVAEVPAAEPPPAANEPPAVAPELAGPPQ